MDEKIDVGYDWHEEKKGGGGKKLLVVLISVIFVGATVLWSYNSVVSLAEAVQSAQAQIESTIQRKADLLPNLVKTVKAYAQHEEKLYKEIAALRSGTQPAGSEDLQSALRRNQQMDRVLQRIMAVAERYPELKSSEQFLQLQAQIEGTENRINVARMLYNEAVREYNAALRKFPGKLIAPLAGLKPAPYFKADEAAKKKIELDL